MLTRIHLQKNQKVGGSPDENEQTGVATKTRSKTKKPAMYKVLLLNDDYTPMEFVVFILQEVFNRQTEDAIRIMTYVHEKGIGIAGTYNFQIAEQKVFETESIARGNEFPLKASFEEI